MRYTDNSILLYRLERIYSRNPFDSYKKIHEKLCEAENITIQADLSVSLLKKYTYFNIQKTALAILATLVSAISLAYSQNFSLSSMLFSIVVSPLILALYLDIIFVWKYFKFDTQAIAPQLSTLEGQLPSISIVIPSRNEPFSVAKMTLDSAFNLSYTNGKKEIVIVDNSDANHPDFERWREYATSLCGGSDMQGDEVRVKFIHREGTEGYKPRNMDIALAHIESDLVMFLDVDSTLRRDTLMRIVPQFSIDESLAFIQLQSIPTNMYSNSRLAFSQGVRAYLQRFFLGMAMHGGYSLFYGHNAVWRKMALDVIGDCLEYHNGQVLITEDMSMSLRAVFKGFHGKNAWLESGEWVPASMRDTEAMWLRWTVGTYQVFAKHLFNRENISKFHLFEKIGWMQHIFLYIGSGLVPIYVAIGLLFELNYFLYFVGLPLLSVLVRAIAAYVKSPLSKMEGYRKVVECYLAFFVFDAFLIWIKAKGLIRFIVRKPNGWKPTGKASEGVPKTLDIIQQRSGILLFGISAVLLGVVRLIEYQELGDLVAAVVAIFFSLNLIASVIVYGKSTMQDTETLLNPIMMSDLKSETL